MHRTRSLTVGMSTNPGDSQWTKSSHARMPIGSYADLENGVTIREHPLGRRPIVAPRVSSCTSPLRWWMWRKWYTSRNASAVTFQLHGTISDRRATVRSEVPWSSASCGATGPSQSVSVGASSDWLTKIHPSHVSHRAAGRHRLALSRPTKSRSSGTDNKVPSVMS